ncbi:hypothetical protein M404DRAFT_996774 [Pisolithus tinctorius Marx 270]|uniref:Uncharacterized protein n=1 Tax=Pisolithus tinctorius Marx 270 TaxID=870435 RepID=A0A0C3P6U4_PISTI|nr:hypothetical protein M404DRAFT_996774 [Pisolithus tinctorius Marx 270]
MYKGKQACQYDQRQCMKRSNKVGAGRVYRLSSDERRRPNPFVPRVKQFGQQKSIKWPLQCKQ